MKHIVIGTAGHVDHGKTSLTRALTGTNTDRWKEEQDRGITLDIGFAQLVLPNGQHASIIDVPGHESLIRNMIVGATGIDVVLLIVAADEGFMPQTQEHLEILSLLGVERGIVVMTKMDMVDEEWADVVEADIADRVKGSFLEGAPVVRVSAQTGEGIDELKEEIVRLIEDAQPKNTERSFRLPVDRSFSVKGFGTVVTGTLVDGTLQVGSDVEVYPKRTKTRVRDLQNHGVSAKEMSAGMRVAANLSNIDKKDVSRGCILAEPGSMLQFDRLCCHIQMTNDAAFAVRNSSRVHFYQGTQQLVCRVRLLDADVLEAGESGFAQLIFDDVVTARNHDRFIIRFFSPVLTVGGGIILDMAPGRVKRYHEKVLTRLEALYGTIGERVLQRVVDAGRKLVSAQELCLVENISQAELASAREELVAEGKCVVIGKGLISSQAFDELRHEIVELLDAYHKAHGLDRGMRQGELRERLFGESPESADELIAALVDEGLICFGGGYVWRANFEPSFSAEQAKLRDQILQAIEQKGFEPVPTADICAEIQAPREEFAQVLARMHADGQLMALTPEISTTSSIYERALSSFTSLFEAADSVTIAQFRDTIAVSRKFAQLFLDAFDRAKISKLVGDARVLLRTS